jgi:hypothetical protein
MMTRRCLLVLVMALVANPPAAGYDLSECVEVTTTIEDPLPLVGDEAADKVAEIVCRKVKDLAPIFGVRLDGRKLVGLFIPEDMKSFTKRTGRGKHTLAVFNARYGIITQPAQTLQMLKNTKRLEETITHELTHYFVHRVAGPSCPIWLHEGLAQWFQGLRIKSRLYYNEEFIQNLEARFRMGGLPIQQVAMNYRAALVLVTKIIRRAGQDELIAALPSVGKHRNVLDIEIGNRTMREWLFSADPPEEELVAKASGKPAGFEVVRGEEWIETLAEEVGLTDRQGKVIRFADPTQGRDGKVTPLPLNEMMKRAGGQR